MRTNAWSLAGALALTLACTRDPSAAPQDANDGGEVSREPAPVVDHGAPLPYHGTWIGPELRLSFVGPWVLITPIESQADAQPIELRVSVERRENDAFALRTSIAQRYAGDFVRPSDWTLLVEDRVLALAMGDEPLEPYVAAPDEVVLVGPMMLDAMPIPDTIPSTHVLACLEVASVMCRALEAEGPRAGGCREAQWGVCATHLDPAQADPTVRAATAVAYSIHASDVALRFAEGLLAAAPAHARASAEAFHGRALADAAKLLGKLRNAGPLPSGDPYLPDLIAALREAGLEPRLGQPE